MVDKLIVSSDKIDKKTLAKHNEKIKDYLEKAGIEVDLSGVRAGDEEAKLKKLREVIHNNAAVLQSTTEDFTLAKKEVDDLGKATKTAFADLVRKDADSEHKTKRDRIRELKGSDIVKVDALKYAENVVLAADKMDPAALKKENEKLKDWLKQNGVDVNLSDLKAGDEVGKAKRIAAAIRDNSHLGELQVTKKDVEAVCKVTHTALDQVIVLDDGPQYTPNQQVPLDLSTVVDKLIVSSDKIDKNTLVRITEMIMDHIKKFDIQFDHLFYLSLSDTDKLQFFRLRIKDFLLSVQNYDHQFLLPLALYKTLFIPLASTSACKTSTREPSFSTTAMGILTKYKSETIAVDANRFAQLLPSEASHFEKSSLKAYNSILSLWMSSQNTKLSTLDLPEDPVLAYKVLRLAFIEMLSCESGQEMMIDIPIEHLEHLPYTKLIPLDHFITHFEHLGALLPSIKRKQITYLLKRLTSENSDLTADQVREAVRSIFLSATDEDTSFFHETPGKLDFVRFNVNQEDEIRVVADLLRANKISDAPLQRQLQQIIADKLHMEGLERELDMLVGDSDDESSENEMTKYIRKLKRLNISFRPESHNALVLYEDGARMFVKNMDFLHTLLDRFDITHFESISMNKVIELLEFSMNKKVGIPVMNYLFLKLQEHPEHNYRLEAMLAEYSPTVSSSLIVHNYLQYLHEKREGVDHKVQFLVILQEKSEIFQELIEEYDVDMTIDELFDFLSRYHPYKLEQIIQNSHEENDSDSLADFSSS